MIVQMRNWSRPARLVALLIVVAAIVLEVAAYLTYRDSVDGQAGLVNVAIVVYAAIAIGFIRMIDRAARRLARRG
jgi:hypothetical protein